MYQKLTTGVAAALMCVLVNTAEGQTQSTILAIRVEASDTAFQRVAVFQYLRERHPVTHMTPQLQVFGSQLAPLFDRIFVKRLTSEGYIKGKIDVSCKDVDDVDNKLSLGEFLDLAGKVELSAKALQKDMYCKTQSERAVFLAGSGGAILGNQSRRRRPLPHRQVRQGARVERVGYTVSNCILFPELGEPMLRLTRLMGAKPNVVVLEGMPLPGCPKGDNFSVDVQVPSSVLTSP